MVLPKVPAALPRPSLNQLSSQQNFFKTQRQLVRLGTKKNILESNFKKQVTKRNLMNPSPFH